MKPNSLCIALLTVSALLRVGSASDAQSPSAPKPTSNRKNVDLYGDALPPGAFARLGTMRFRSTGGFSVRSGLSADGKLLAVPGERLIRLFDPCTGAEVRRLIPPAEAAGRAVFSADGRFLAVAGDNRIQVCDLRKNKWLPALTYEGSASYDGLTLAGAVPILAVTTRLVEKKERFVQVFDCATGRNLASFNVDEALGGLELSPDGQVAALWGREPSGAKGRRTSPAIVRLLDPRTAKEIRRVDCSDVVSGLSFTPDSQQIVAYFRPQQQVGFFDLKSGEETRRLDRGEQIHFAGNVEDVALAAFSADRSRLALADSYGTIDVWDLNKGRFVGSFRPKGARGRLLLDGIDSFAFAGDRLIASCMDNLRTWLWDVTSGKPLTSDRGHRGPVELIWFSRDSRRITSLAAGGTEIYDWDPINGQPQKPEPADREATLLDHFKGGGDFFDHIPVTQGRYVMRAAVVGKYIAIAEPMKTFIQFGDLSAGKLGPAHFGQAECFRSGIALSPDAKKVAAAHWKWPTKPPEKPVCRLSVWETASGTRLASFVVSADEDSSLSPAFLGDGSLIALPMEDGTVAVWDIAAGIIRRTLAAHPGWDVVRMAVAPDERAVALGLHERKSGADKIQIWEIPSGLLLREFTNTDSCVASLCFSPDSMTVASGFDDTTALLWDVYDRRGHSRKASALSAEEVASLWSDLDYLDSQRVCRARVRLAEQPAKTLPLFSNELKPVEPSHLNAAEVAELVRKLDHRKSSVRQEAVARLRNAGKAVEVDLKQALQRNGSAEVRESLARLLKEMGSAEVPRELIRPLRALAILEAIGTPPAKALLRRIAGGRHGAILTTEAEYSLRRLARREAQKP